MEKEKMIEEMKAILEREQIKIANTVEEFAKLQKVGITRCNAEALYNANCRVVPEGSVILMKEELEKHDEKIRKGTSKEILILLGKGFDETKMTEFRNLPWYKLFCRELKHRYDVEVE